MARSINAKTWATAFPSQWLIVLAWQPQSTPPVTFPSGLAFAAISAMTLARGRAFASGKCSRMRWFRANRLFGGCLALFALAIQLAVSFAHTHPQDFLPKQKLGFADKTSNAAVLTQGRTSFGKRTDNPDGGLPHDDCPICASISLIGSALNTQAPALSAPAHFDLVQLQFFSDFQFRPIRHFLAHTRAPPTA